MASVESLSTDISNLRITLLDEIKANENNITNKVVALEDVVSKHTKELNDSIFHIRNRVLTILREENVTLRNRVHTLEARVIKIETQLNRVEQNHRKSNLELDGIPQSVTQEELAPTVVKIYNAISGKKLEVDDVEAVHRLHSKKNPKPVIVRMKRNFIDTVHKNRKNLKDVGERVNIPGARIFVNNNLSPSEKSVEFNARQLLKDGLISDVWFSNMSVRIKCLNGKILVVNHEIELYEAFPLYEGFSFDSDLYERVLNNDMIDLFDGFYGEHGDGEHLNDVSPVTVL